MADTRTETPADDACSRCGFAFEHLHLFEGRPGQFCRDCAVELLNTKTEKTVADELREAAAKLRRVAAGTTEGRWVCGQLEEQEDFSHQVAVSAEDALVAEINLNARDAAWRYMRDRAVRDAQWIALASPALAEPLASWLKQTASDYEAEVNPRVSGRDRTQPFCDRCGLWLVQVCTDQELCSCWDDALAVARVLNGTAPQEVAVHG